MKPRPHEPCRMPPIMPRERTGQVSIASAARPAIPPPCRYRAARGTGTDRRKSARSQRQSCASEYHKIEIISGILRRPGRRANPSPTAPTQPQPQCHRQHERDLGQWDVKFLRDRHHDQQEHGEVEGIECPTQPAAHQASHWSFVGSFHHGIGFSLVSCWLRSLLQFLPCCPPERFARCRNFCKLEHVSS